MLKEWWMVEFLLLLNWTTREKKEVMKSIDLFDAHHLVSSIFFLHYLDRHFSEKSFFELQQSHEWLFHDVSFWSMNLSAWNLSIKLIYYSYMILYFFLWHITISWYLYDTCAILVWYHHESIKLIIQFDPKQSSFSNKNWFLLFLILLFSLYVSMPFLIEIPLIHTYVTGATG